MSKPRIAILGGGVGSVTTAFHLSKPGWRQHFDAITLYQQGWRLGGKGASGRGADLRIEEHGLHIWFGFYENAFSMLRRCHEELDALASVPGAPARWPLAFSSVADSFHPCTEIALADHDGCCWKWWAADFFDYDDDRPWIQPDPRPPGMRPGDWSVAFFAGRCLQLAADLALSLAPPRVNASITTATAGAPPAQAVHDPMSALEDVFGALWDTQPKGLVPVLQRGAGAMNDAAGAIARNPLALEALDDVLRLLDVALGMLRGRYDDEVRAHDSVRRAYYVVDLMIAIVRGVIEDGVVAVDDFSVIDDAEFKGWLMSHGAARESVECALVRTVVYDLAFAYRGGDPQRPACGAGTALRGLLRAFFTYRGALMWKMNSGMGDVVFAPLYELLHKRGVDVEFFNRVEHVRAANGRVETIEIDVQAVVPAATTARDHLTPSTDPALGKAGALWPADPAAVLGTAALTPGSVYESWYAGRSACRTSTVVLKRGDPQGFDAVVFGLPISCVPLVAPDLPAQSKQWSAAVSKIETVATQALQLWLDKPATALSAHATAGVVLGGYTEPFDTWADMGHLVSQESVPGARTIAYFCNVLADSTLPPRGAADKWLSDQDALVRAQALRFLSGDIGDLWPLAIDQLTGELDWQRLIAPSQIVGHARLDYQFMRANVEPSERYVLSVPGSAASRIKPDATGFENLYAAGDWTACELDAGCVEAAVISGMIAANGIHRALGDPANVEAIIGEHGP